MSVEMEIGTNLGQVTATGDIINCHGGAECPFRGDGTPEYQRQADFAAATGIWCSRGVREQLDNLITERGFTGPKLSASWKAGNLIADEDGQKIAVRTSWLEAAFGYSMAAILLVYWALQVAEILAVGPGAGWRGAVAVVTATGLYGGMGWLVVRFVLVPYNVARRVRRILSS